MALGKEKRNKEIIKNCPDFEDTYRYLFSYPNSYLKNENFPVVLNVFRNTNFFKACTKASNEKIWGLYYR